MKKIIISVLSAFAVLTAAFVTVNAQTAGEGISAVIESGAEEGYPEAPLRPDYPEIYSFENTSSGVLVKWSSVPNAGGYRLYEHTSSGWHKLVETSALEYTYKGAKNDAETVYTVRALDENRDFLSDYYSPGWTHIYYAPPALKTILNWEDGAELYWTPYKNAPNCRVMRRLGSGAWRTLGNSSDGYFVDSTATPGLKYTYTLAVTDSGSDTLLSAYNSGTPNIHTTTPVITGFQNIWKGVKISWEACPSAAKYRVYERKADGKWRYITETSSTYAVDRSVADGAEKTYTVRCLGSDGGFISGYHVEGYSNIFFDAPAVKSFNNTENGAIIRWDRPEGAQLYAVYRRELSENSWHRIGVSESDSFTDTTAKAGTEYLYTLRMLSFDESRFLSSHDDGVKHTYVSQPEITSITNTEDGAKIVWGKCAGAAYYRIYVRTPSGWQNQLTTSANSYVDAKAESGVERTYTVRALDQNRDFISSYNSDGRKNTFYAAPKVTKISRASNGVKIEWEEVAGAKFYRVYRKEFGGSWGRIVNSVEKTSFTDTSGDKDKLYAYTVRCLDSEGGVISDYYNYTLYYRDGKIAKGIVTSGGKKYYYEDNGSPAKNKIVGSKTEGYFYAGSDGVICESEDIKLAVDFVVKNATGTTSARKLHSCFRKLVSYDYATVFGAPKNAEDMKNMGIRMFKQKNGNCYCYGAAFALIARVLGYDSRAVSGQILMYHGGLGGHGWADIKTNSGWLICDPDMDKYSYSPDSYYLVTFARYPTKPLVYGTNYYITVENGKSVWK